MENILLSNMAFGLKRDWPKHLAKWLRVEDQILMTIVGVFAVHGHSQAEPKQEG